MGILARHVRFSPHEQFHSSNTLIATLVATVLTLILAISFANALVGKTTLIATTPCTPLSSVHVEAQW
jgi:hypothetical protein